MASLGDGFNKLAHWTSVHAGRASTFAMALAVLAIWGASGPIFQWSEPAENLPYDGICRADKT